MNLFAVFKSGVYLKYCCGVFSTRKLAEDAAALCKSKEADDYHNFEIVELALDVVIDESGVAVTGRT